MTNAEGGVANRHDVTKRERDRYTSLRYDAWGLGIQRYVGRKVTVC